MNLQIHNVISDITGVTGLTILDAILSGERDPRKLAGLEDRRIKADDRTIIKSLEGDYRPEHLFTLKQALQIYCHYRQMIGDCDIEIEKHLRDFESRIDSGQPPSVSKTSRRKPQGNEPNFDLHSHLCRILGIDLTQVDGISVLTSHVIFTEVGPDVSKFPSGNHFSSWLGLCPHNKVSGGRILSSKTRPGSNRAAQARRLSAQSLWNSHSCLGNYYRRIHIC